MTRESPRLLAVVPRVMLRVGRVAACYGPTDRYAIFAFPSLLKPTGRFKHPIKGYDLESSNADSSKVST